MKKSFIILLLFLISQWVPARECVEYIIREDGVYYGSYGKYRKIDDADPETFVVEISTTPYAKDMKNVYWNGEKLPDADAATFKRIMNTDYGADNKNAYFQSQKLYDVDMESFRVLKHNLAADKNYIYSKASVLDSLRTNFSYYAEFVISGDNIYEEYEDLDPATLEIIKSKNHRAMNKCDEYMSGKEETVNEYFNIYDDDIKYNNGNNLKGVDMETFKILNICYAKDTTMVFCVFNEVTGADPETFRELHQFTGKDKHAVYSGWKQILYADPNSFEMLNRRYGKDDTNVFFDELKVSGANLKTFAPINEYYARDKKTAFFESTAIAGSDPRSFSASEYLYPYSKDKKAVYYKTETIKNADPASFVLLHQGYSKDKQSVFLHASVIPEADPETFKWIVGTDYSTDRQHVFFQGKKLENSDGMSFRVLDDDYCLDKNNVYYHGQKTDADPDIFKIISSEYGYPFYPGNEEKLKNFIMSRLDFSKYPHKTDYNYTALCWFDTLGKVERVKMSYFDFHNEYSEWADEIVHALYSMPDWHFPISAIKDSAFVTIPFIFEPSNQIIDPDEEYNEIFNLHVNYPEFSGGISRLERFFTNNLQRLKLDVKDRLTGEVTSRFRVGKDGSVDNAYVIKSLSAPYDNEVLRIINMQPHWKPGKARWRPTSGICEVTVFFSGDEVQKQYIKRIELIELDPKTLGDSFVFPAENGYERLIKKYRRLNDITIKFDN